MTLLLDVFLIIYYFGATGNQIFLNKWLYEIKYPINQAAANNNNFYVKIIQTLSLLYYKKVNRTLPWVWRAHHFVLFVRVYAVISDTMITFAF